MSDYDTDVLLWSERQGRLLRRLAAGERLNDQIDWDHVVEEVESVGRSELHRTESLLIQALRHRLKMLAWPDSSEVSHWEEEAIIFQMDAGRAFQGSMRQHLDMDWIYRRTRHRFPGHIAGRPPLPLPQTCPFNLDELLAEP